MSDELKPCPFCGGKPTFVHATSEDIGNGYVCRTLAVISCDHCMFDMTGKTDEDAVVTWNARAERTCRMEPAVGGGWYCSECHIWVAFDAMANATEHMAPRFCPNCSAKVVG